MEFKFPRLHGITWRGRIVKKEQQSKDSKGIGRKT
jgi:hypothetical protein